MAVVSASTRSVARLVTLGLVVSAALIALPATWVQAADTPPETSFSFTSASPDEYIGQGQQVNVKESSSVVFRRQGVEPNGLSIQMLFDGEPFPRFTISLVPGRGDQFRHGTFSSAERARHATGYAPGLEVTADNRGCNSVYGSFIIRQLERSSTGAITVLEASFTQRCERSTAPVLQGTLKLNALPLSFAYRSEAGSHVGKGTSKSYNGGNTVIQASSPYDNRISIGISGLRDRWSISLAGIDGARLEPGRYATSRSGSATEAVLDVDGNGSGCNISTGTLRVISVWYRPDGVVGGLHATFTQRCQGDAGQLSGTIRYLA